MLPFHDENPTRNFPLFTIGLIALNTLIYFWEMSHPVVQASLIYEYGMIPYDVIHSPIQTYPTVFSAMFLHAGLGHLLGNMLYLWVFGNNIEDTLGKLFFILFYLLCGMIAALSHVAADMNSEIPMVGASGAISGILGAYVVLFPRAKVKTLIFLGFLITIIRIPAAYLLLFWIGLQIFNNMMAGGEGGVAWLAHIGGFFAGMILIVPFKTLARRSGPRNKPTSTTSNT